MSGVSPKNALLVRAGEVLCSIELADVVETLRPLPVGRLDGAPEIVSGVSIIRGSPVPIIGLGKLFRSPSVDPKRLVLIRAGDHRIALAVEEVIGVFDLAPVADQALPPLLSKAAAEAIHAIGALDSELLFALDSAKLVPEDVWRSIAQDSHDSAIQT